MSGAGRKLAGAGVAENDGGCGVGTKRQEGWIGCSQPVDSRWRNRK